MSYADAQECETAFRCLGLDARATKCRVFEWGVALVFDNWPARVITRVSLAESLVAYAAGQVELMTEFCSAEELELRSKIDRLSAVVSAGRGEGDA